MIARTLRLPLPIPMQESGLRPVAHLVHGNHDKDFRDTGCFESDSYYRKIRLSGRKVILFHYPIAEWDGKWRGSIHRHGHSHNGPEYNRLSIEQGLLRFDVDVDANSFMPVSEGAVLELARQAEANNRSCN